jgi:hypothetical protein
MASRPFGKATAQDHVFYFSWIKTRAFDGMADDISSHRRAMSAVQASAKGFTNSCPSN